VTILVKCMVSTLAALVPMWRGEVQADGEEELRGERADRAQQRRADIGGGAHDGEGRISGLAWLALESPPDHHADQDTPRAHAATAHAGPCVTNTPAIIANGTAPSRTNRRGATADRDG
jgi:hypothetical protein